MICCIIPFPTIANTRCWEMKYIDLPLMLQKMSATSDMVWISKSIIKINFHHWNVCSLGNHTF